MYGLWTGGLVSRMIDLLVWVALALAEYGSELGLGRGNSGFLELH